MKNRGSCKSLFTVTEKNKMLYRSVIYKMKKQFHEIVEIKHLTTDFLGKIIFNTPIIIVMYVRVQLKITTNICILVLKKNNKYLTIYLFIYFFMFLFISTDQIKENYLYVHNVYCIQI